MTKILLIRHGDTDYVDEALAGRIDSPLNSEGIQQAEKIADKLQHLPIKAIYTSPLMRTQQTAQPLASLLKINPIVSDKLNQVDFGNWQGLSYEELIQDPNWKRFKENPGSVKIPGGEDGLMVRERVSQEYQKIIQQFSNDVVIVSFSHGSIIRHTISYFIGLPLNNTDQIQISPASISTLLVENSKGKLLHLNQEITLNWL